MALDKRAFILVMDSCGIGAAPDADKFGDVGSDTFGHIAEHCAKGLADVEGLRSGPLNIPNLMDLGLGEANFIARGNYAQGVAENKNPTGIFGACAEKSSGKDTPSGHWEMAGLPVMFDWGYFSTETPSFPPELIEKFIKEAGVPGILGNCHASGTVIIDALGEEHMQSGKPICYTSSDSVFQIAAHEESFGLDRLYEVCDIARKLVDQYNIGRVIARPFIGEKSGQFKRTGNRRDISTPPHGETLLDVLKSAGHEVISVGKIADIFAHRGLTQKIKATGNDALFAQTRKQQQTALDGSLVFTNFVDFDQDFGHRRNVAGYADALERFDVTLAEFRANMRSGDIAIITADHGCDPTSAGSDHTREFVPFLCFGPEISGKNIGRRETFADIGQSLAHYLEVSPLKSGISVL